MARKRTSEPEIAVSQNTTPAVRRKPAPAHKKHTPVAAAEPAAGLAAAPEVAVEQPAAVEYQPTREDVAALAYSYWVGRGYQGGSPEEDWLRAERELSRAAVQAANA
jgi:hypothetical protein